MGRKKSISFMETARRLTGFSTPIFGVQWNPPESERETVRRLLHFLEDRRALYVPYCLEVTDQVERSLLQIREELTRTLQTLPEDSKAAGPIRAMRAACRKFLTGDHPEFPHMLEARHREWGPPPRHHRHEASPGFFVALGELRATFGTHIADLAVRYGLDLEEDLAPILPAEPHEDGPC